LSEYLSQANSNVAIIIQIETLSAFENIEDIAKVTGIGIHPLANLIVDLLFVGPFDLSNALGHPLVHGEEHGVVSSAIKRILDVGHANGKKVGIFTTSYADARRRVEQGFDMVHIGTDVNLLVGAVAGGVAESLGQESPSKKVEY
jgi:4-hydroxy-2-oxoheptanedioate aldolase